jgi:hypothetical protein
LQHAKRAASLRLDMRCREPFAPHKLLLSLHSSCFEVITLTVVECDAMKPVDVNDREVRRGWPRIGATGTRWMTQLDAQTYIGEAGAFEVVSIPSLQQLS